MRVLGQVCTRTPHPSRPGARRSSTVRTLTARMKAIRGLGRQLKKDGIESVTLESTSVIRGFEDQRSRSRR